MLQNHATFLKKERKEVIAEGTELVLTWIQVITCFLWPQ